jgi:predicted dehydrogenase
VIREKKPQTTQIERVIMKNVTRRNFIKASMLTTAALSWPARSWSRVLGANDDIRLAVVGFNGRGKDHIEGNRKLPGVRIVALCDVDRDVLEKEAQKFRDRSESVETYTDVRKLLEDKNIDAISTATPNHWHALISIWACQAGKDVYVEKPVSHNVWEGRQIVEAARKYNRIVQTGTQSRSSTGLHEAMKFLHDGQLGKIKLARALCYKRRPSIGKVSAPQPVPESVDYDLWCGPAPKESLMRARLHYDWHWVWPTGCGDLGNQGIHQMDLARWALNVNELSPRVFSIGGRLGYVDDGSTPNTQIVVHDYQPAPLIFEVRGLPASAGTEKMGQYRGAGVGVVIDCEHGYMVIPNYSGAIVYDNSGNEIKKFEGGGDHHANFINAVRTRKASDLNAEILEGHLSSALCHTGNVSYRLGKEASPRQIFEAIKDDKEAAESFGRFEEHLAVNGVDLIKTKATIGPVLKMNPKTERFTNNKEANELLTRNYRAPFVVPEKV